MLESIINFDKSAFLYLNGLNHSIIDPIALFISYSFIPIIIIILGFNLYGYKKIKKSIFLAFFFMLVGFGLSDSISSRIFKPHFERLRPCHEQEFRPIVHTAGKSCWGGKFGFVSSHSANSFSVALFIWLLFRRHSKHFAWIFVYSGLVAYSRIYLAKHYPLDIICGGLLGLGCGLIAFKCYELINQKFILRRQGQ